MGKSESPVRHLTAAMVSWTLLFALPAGFLSAQEKKPTAAPAAGSLYNAGAPPAKAPEAGKQDAAKKGLAEEFSRRVTFNGQVRFRYEYLDPFAYKTSTSTAVSSPSDDYVLQRTRLSVNLDVHERISAFVQIQDSRLWGEEQTVLAKSQDTLDLHQGFLTVRKLFGGWTGDGDLSLIAGRQELAYGDQRLVSPLDWSNVVRAWDAGRLVWTAGGPLRGLQVDAFASIIKDSTAGLNGFPSPQSDGADEKQEFHGLYATYRYQPLPSVKIVWPFERGAKPVFTPHVVDGYAFYRSRHTRDLPDDAGTSSTGNADDVTVGTRFKGGALGLDYGFEVAGQTGRQSKQPVDAYGFVLEGGYNIPPELLGGKTKLRLGVEFDYGSGDEDPADGHIQSFDPLFPFGHAYQGYQDIFSWKNGQDLVFKLTTTLPPCPYLEMNPVWFEAQYHLFWLTEDKDAWYDAALSRIRRDATGSAGPFVGSELDLHAKYNLIEYGGAAGSPPGRLWLWTGYSHFFPAEFVRNTGDSPDRDFFYLQVQLDT